MKDNQGSCSGDVAHTSFAFSTTILDVSTNVLLKCASAVLASFSVLYPMNPKRLELPNLKGHESGRSAILVRRHSLGGKSIAAEIQGRQRYMILITQQIDVRAFHEFGIGHFAYGAKVLPEPLLGKVLWKVLDDQPRPVCSMLMSTSSRDK